MTRDEFLKLLWVPARSACCQPWPDGVWWRPCRFPKPTRP